MTKTLLNTKQVASLFNVDTSTIRRWSLSGKLNCSSSKGGHRKFTYKNIIDFIKTKDADFNFDMHEINKIAQHSSTESTILSISRNALQRNSNTIETSLIQLYLKGNPVQQIFDTYIDKSLDHIQELLEKNDISVAEEHIARKTISIALNYFRNAIIPEELDIEKKALCLNLENDIPDISIDMIQIALEMKLYSVFNSGSNTSIKDLRTLLKKQEYDSLYIFMCDRQCCTATVKNHIDYTIENLEHINELCSKYSIDLFIGGPATSLIDNKVSFKYNKFLKFSEI